MRNALAVASALIVIAWQLHVSSKAQAFLGDLRAHIDVIFLDEAGCIVRTDREVQLNRPFVACRGARSVVELGAGALDGRDLLVGDRLELEDR